MASRRRVLAALPEMPTLERAKVTPSPPLSPTSAFSLNTSWAGFIQAPTTRPSGPNFTMENRDTRVCTRTGGVSSVKAYQILQQIGAGSYGTVHKAIDQRTGDVVAIKCIFRRPKDFEEGISVNLLREIRLLKSCTHDNIVRLREIVCGFPERAQQQRNDRHQDDNVCAQGQILFPIIHLVFDYVSFDLTALIDLQRAGVSPAISVPQALCYTRQLMSALEYLHSQHIIHRDIKCSNVLISRRHHLQLTDFGFARRIDKDQRNPMTNRVITLWYRPPEILLGAPHYDSSADMWSVGCIIPEMLLGIPLFNIPNEIMRKNNVESEIVQLKKIFSICGVPTEKVWKEYFEMPRTPSLRLGKGYRNILSHHLRIQSKKRQHLVRIVVHLNFAS